MIDDELNHRQPQTTDSDFQQAAHLLSLTVRNCRRLSVVRSWICVIFGRWKLVKNRSWQRGAGRPWMIEVWLVMCSCRQRRQSVIEVSEYSCKSRWRRRLFTWFSTRRRQRESEVWLIAWLGDCVVHGNGCHDDDDDDQGDVHNGCRANQVSRDAD